MKFHKNKIVESPSGQIRVKPSYYIVPESIEDVVAIILKAEKEKKKISPFGRGWSFNKDLYSKDYILDMENIRHFTDVTNEYQSPQLKKGNRLIEVGGGIEIGEMVSRLDKLGLTIPGHLPISGQTIGGIVSTSSHGCDITCGPVYTSVRSILLIGSKGKIIRVEPKSGISKYKSKPKSKVELIQDNDAFNSACVSIGLCGVIYSVIIEAIPQHYLIEQKTMEKWSKLKRRINAGKLFKGKKIVLKNEKTYVTLVGLCIYFSPYEVRGDHQLLVSRIFRVPANTGDFPAGKFAKLIKKIAGVFALPLVATGRLNEGPLFITRNILEAGMKLNEAKPRVDKSHRIWDQGLSFGSKYVFGTEFEYEYKESEIVEIIEKIFENYQQLMNEGFKPYIPCPIRFSQGGPALLDPTQGKFAVYVSVPVLAKYKKGPEFLRRLQEFHYQNGAKVHWGKYNDLYNKDGKKLEEDYKNLEKWKSWMRYFNSTGVFDSKFGKRVGLIEPVRKGENTNKNKITPAAKLENRAPTK